MTFLSQANPHNHLLAMRLMFSKVFQTSLSIFYNWNWKIFRLFKGKLRTFKYAWSKLFDFFSSNIAYMNMLSSYWIHNQKDLNFVNMYMFQSHARACFTHTLGFSSNISLFFYSLIMYIYALWKKSK